MSAKPRVFDGLTIWQTIYKTATLAMLTIGCAFIFQSTKDKDLSFGIWCVGMAMLLKGN